MKHKSLKLFAIAAMACMTFGALASCGGESAPESTPVSDVAEDVGLTISETTLSVSINKQKTLTATTKDDSKYLFTWKTSDEEIATVSKGVVTGVKEGTCTITVSVKKKGTVKTLDSKTCEVTVINRVLTLDQKELTISLSESSTATLHATVTDNAPITWSSSDETIATVANGVVTGLKSGTCTITATSEDLSESCLVTVYSNYFSLPKTEILAVGSRKALEVTGKKSDDAVFTSSDPSIVSIEGDEVVALKTGMAVVTLKSEADQIEASCVVMVKGTGEEVAELPTGKKSEAANNPGNWYYLCESDLVTVSAIPNIDNGLIHADVTRVGKEDGTISGPNMFYLSYQPDATGYMIYDVTFYLYSSNNTLLSINGGADTEYKAGLNIIKEENLISKAPKEGAPYQIKFKAASDYYIIPVFTKIGEVEKMSLSESEIELDLYGTTTHTLTATVPGVEDAVCEWASSDETVATVEAGVVTALKEGTCTITASYGDESASCVVTVINSEANKLTISAAEASIDLNNGGTYTLTASKPNVEASSITWSSSDETIATVEGGVVTGHKRGTATINAVYGEETVSCLVTVINSTDVELPGGGTKKIVTGDPGKWYYLYDSSQVKGSTPLKNEAENKIFVNLNAIGTSGSNFAYLRYQPSTQGTYTVTLNIDFKYNGTEEEGATHILEIVGGTSSKTATTETVVNGTNTITYTFTTDSSTPFQIKFKTTGSFEIEPTFTLQA